MGTSPLPPFSCIKLQILFIQVPPSSFEAVEDLLLVQLVQHNDVLTWTPHAQTPFILSPLYIVSTPRFFHFMGMFFMRGRRWQEREIRNQTLILFQDATTFRVKGTIPIKRVKSMSMDTMHKGLFSLHGNPPPLSLFSFIILFLIIQIDGETRKSWMFLCHNEKMIGNIVDMIRKNQATTLTGVCS